MSGRVFQVLVTLQRVIESERVERCGYLRHWARD